MGSDWAAKVSNFLGEEHFSFEHETLKINMHQIFIIYILIFLTVQLCNPE